MVGELIDPSQTSPTVYIVLLNFERNQRTILCISFVVCIAARRHGAAAVQGRRLRRLPGPRGLHQRAARRIRGLPDEVSLTVDY